MADVQLLEKALDIAKNYTEGQTDSQIQILEKALQIARKSQGIELQ